MARESNNLSVKEVVDHYLANNKNIPNPSLRERAIIAGFEANTEELIEILQEEVCIEGYELILTAGRPYDIQPNTIYLYAKQNMVCYMVKDSVEEYIITKEDVCGYEINVTQKEVQNLEPGMVNLFFHGGGLHYKYLKYIGNEYLPVESLIPRIDPCYDILLQYKDFSRQQLDLIYKAVSLTSYLKQDQIERERCFAEIKLKLQMPEGCDLNEEQKRLIYSITSARGYISPANNGRVLNPEILKDIIAAIKYIPPVFQEDENLFDRKNKAFKSVISLLKHYIQSTDNLEQKQYIKSKLTGLSASLHHSLDLNATGINKSEEKSNEGVLPGTKVQIKHSSCCILL